MLQIFEEGLQKIFILILNMTLTGSVVIAAVLFARLLLKKAPRIFSYGLWAAVLFRLLCPVSFSLPVSLLGALQNKPAEAGRMEYIAEDIGYWEKPQVDLPVPGISETVNEYLPMEDREASVNPMQLYLTIGAYVWLLGVMSMGVYSVLSLWRFKKRLGDAVWEKDNIYRFRKKGSPFVCGLLRPRIYLPEQMKEEEEQYILLHEQIHIKRGDAVFRLLACLALWLHWFNPLVWAAFVLSGRDMEMSCDEAVIRRLGSRVKKEYSASLLNMASGGRIVKGVPLAFGESDTGSRIKNVLRYQKSTALLMGGAALISVALSVIFLANPARAKENENIFYGVVTQVVGVDGGEETILRIPGLGDVVAPEAKDISLYLERDAEEIIMPGDLLRITFLPDQEIQLSATEQYGQTLYRFDSASGAEAESIQVMGEGFAMERQEGDRYLFAVPFGMADQARAGDTLELYHDPEADSTEEIYLSAQAGTAEPVLFASAEVLSVDAAHYDIWVELSAEETETFLSEFGFGITAELIQAQTSAGGEETLTGVSEVPPGEEEENTEASYPGALSDGTDSGLFSLSPERLKNKELPDGMYVVYVQSISNSARGFDRYVTQEDYEDLPLFPFAEECEFRVNWEKDKLSYSPVSFDKFADLVTQSARVINPPVYCEVRDNLIVRAELESGYYVNGFTYERPVNGSLAWNQYAENTGRDQHMTAEEVLGNYYTLSGAETADIGDGAGMEQIEVYTGNIGDGESGVVLFKNKNGEVLGSEFAHAARAGWNNIYIGDADGVNYILTVHIEDRDTYGEYSYQVYRLGEGRFEESSGRDDLFTETGEIRQIAGSRFEFGDSYRYDDEMFHAWADDLAYYLKNSHLVLSSQEGEIRTETVSEADKYNYGTLRREL